MTEELTLHTISVCNSGRNSNNDLIRARLGWAPSTPLIDGLRKTYFWVKAQVARDEAKGIDVHGPEYTSSRVVVRHQPIEGSKPACSDDILRKDEKPSSSSGWKEEEEMEQEAA